MYDITDHLNELRQKLKFYKDIYRHYYAIKARPSYRETVLWGNDSKVIHYAWFSGNE